MNQQLTTIERHDRNLSKCMDKFEAVLPPHMSPAKLKQSVLTALGQNNYLANCDPTSILQSAMTAAVLGLEVDNALGQGYIVPYGRKAQFIPGYKGYITLARNNGFTVSGTVVREHDAFEYHEGLNPDLKHRPAAGGATERGAIQYAYATARHATLPSVFKVVHVEHINEIRDSSQGYQAYMSKKIKSNPWASNYEQMAVKTAIRALASQLPLNVQKAAAIEGGHERGEIIYLNEQGDIEGEAQVADSGATEEQPDLVQELSLGDAKQDPTYGGQYNPENGDIHQA